MIGIFRGGTPAHNPAHNSCRIRRFGSESEVGSPLQVIESERREFGPQWERALKRALLYQLSYAPTISRLF